VHVNSNPTAFNGVVDANDQPLLSNIPANFCKNLKWVQRDTHYSGAQGNHEKILKSKISCQTPFNCLPECLRDCLANRSLNGLLTCLRTRCMHLYFTPACTTCCLKPLVCLHAQLPVQSPDELPAQQQTQLPVHDLPHAAAGIYLFFACLIKL
jgi:hypothetical protein